MTSESVARPFSNQGPAAGAFEAFFEMFDAPAALCDLGLTVLKANAHFEMLCDGQPLVGKRLGDLIELQTEEVPQDRSSFDVEVLSRAGQQVKLTLTRRGQTVAVVARRSPMLDSLAAAGRALIEQARIEAQLLAFGRDVASATSEEELVTTVARGVKGLFAGRTFAVRILDPRTNAITSLYADGPLKEGRRDVFHLRHSMVEKTHLELGTPMPNKVVVVTSGELPHLFEGSARALAVPLVASGQLFGALNIEYPPGLTADLLSDERILIQLANQAAVAVRNAKLIDELTFMRKYLEELLENANALILVANREGRVVVFNGALVRLTGLAKSEVLGHDVAQLVPESERLKLLKILDAALRGEAIAGQELFLSTSEGREMRVAFATSAALSQSGEVEGVIFIGHDLTRTRELERRIIQAEKLASLGQLAASVVHEINNPMTAVSTYAEALLMRAMLAPSANPGDVEKFRRIVENSERVLRFTRDLVNYARPAQEKPEEIELNAVIQRALSFCEHVVRKHGVTLVTQLGELPRFLAVRQNLVQVFVNLITNACHATPAGGTITVRTVRNAEVAVAVVSDTGAGMEPKVAVRVFEPFFTTKPDGKGTGLGLSIVQSIVENHGGQVTVESEVGKGTAFTIRLPMLSARRS